MDPHFANHSASTHLVQRNRALATLLSSAFISLLAVSILNVSVPAFTKSLAMSSSGVQWTISGYALSFGIALVPAGRLGDTYGRRRLFIAGNLLFILAAAGGGLAVSGQMLIAMRLVEGFAAATISPQVMGLIQLLFKGPERARAYGLFGLVIGVATAIGPPLGGILLGLAGNDLGWRMAFFINLPICVCAIFAARRYLPANQAVELAIQSAVSVSSDIAGASGRGFKEDAADSASPVSSASPVDSASPVNSAKPADLENASSTITPALGSQTDSQNANRTTSAKESQTASATGNQTVPADASRATFPQAVPSTKLNLDLPGIVILGGSFLALMLPFMSGAQSVAQLRQAPWLLLVVAAFGLAAFLWWERFSEGRGRDVIFPHLLRHDYTYVVGTFILGLYFAGWSGLFVVYTLYLQQGLGLAPWAAGLMQLPIAVGSGLCSPLSARLVVRYGRKILVISSAIVTLGLLVSILVTRLAPPAYIPWILLFTMFVAGCGSGLFVSPAQSISLATIPLQVGATAAGAAQTVQRSATAMGVACSTLMFYVFLGEHTHLQAGTNLAREAYTSAFTAGFGTVCLLIALTFAFSLADALIKRDNPLLDH